MKQGWLEFSDLTTPPAKRPVRQPSEAAGHSVANRNEIHRASQVRAPSDRERILRLLQSEQHFVTGLTRDEIAVALGMQLATVCGRCRELLVDCDEGEQAAIYETVLRRPTRTGSSAVVLCARERKD
jgi:hypothetical protein